MSLLVFNSHSFAFQVTPNWNAKFEKEITIECSEPAQCLEICDEEKSCTVKEETCTNCLGSDVFLTFIFNEMGRVIQNNQSEILATEVIDLIKSGFFTTINSKSVYNHVDSYNSLSLRRKFRSLCSDSTQYPLVFISQDNRNRKLDEILFVQCDNGFYQLEIDYNQDTLREDNYPLY